MACRLEVQPPKVRIGQASGRDALRIRLTGWTIRTTPRALAELSLAELDFGLALAFMSRLEPDQKKPHWVVAPFLGTTFSGFSIVFFGRASFVDQFWVGFMVLFGSMVVGYVGSLFVSAGVSNRAKQRVLSEALNITGNASAAETYLIRCKTDHLLFGQRRLASADREQLDQQLDALHVAAGRLGLSYVPVGLND